MSIYIDRASQISIQQPLCNEWMTNPLTPANKHNKFICPDFKQFISPAVSRRMETVLRCAITTALDCTKEEERTSLDGILTGSGLGCIMNTEKFLTSMLQNGEEGLSPSNFMQSTHNTIGSQIAIAFKCHGYNITYSHRGTSFDSALFNAILKFKLNEFNTALVNGTDEMTDAYYQLFDQVDWWEKEKTPQSVYSKEMIGPFSGENSVSFLLTRQQSEHSLCEICDIELLHTPSDKKITECVNELFSSNGVSKESIDAIIIGSNGGKENDEEYDRLCQLIQPSAEKVTYKQLFGESFTMSSFGIYVGATCLKEGYIPKHLTRSGKKIEHPKCILVLNHFQKLDYSITLLKVC